VNNINRNIGVVDLLCDVRTPPTAAELKVAYQVLQGMTNREIAIRMSRSEHTIKTHVERLIRKSGEKNRVLACLRLIEWSRPD
jgi:DNA-binding CsgD family transcriptional regulator